MKQILQNIKNGQTELVDVPKPLCRSGLGLIASRASLVSVGTERMLVDFGKAGWIEKARQQPEKVKQVLPKKGTPYLSRVVILGRDPVTVDVPVAFNDPSGTYEMTVTDLFTQKTVTRTWSVQ